MGPLNEKFYAVIVNAGILEMFTSLIDHPKAAIRQEIVQALSTLMVHSTRRVQKCIELGLVENIITKMASDGDPKVRSNAIWAISNAFYKATPE